MTPTEAALRDALARAAMRFDLAAENAKERAPVYRKWADEARAALSQPSPASSTVGEDVRDNIIRSVVEEAEQACRYVAKHNVCNMEDGPYRDGFEIASEVCEKAIADHVKRHDDRIPSLPLSVEAVYLSDRFKWAAPGDQQEDAWLVRFCDNDVRDAYFTGPDAEREAWEAWNRHAPGYNMYVFRLAALSKPTPVEAGLRDRWTGVIPLVEEIMQDEGATITFTGPNPDFNGLPNECVVVNGPSTNWTDKDFRADTLADCLRAALSETQTSQEGG